MSQGSPDICTAITTLVRGPTRARTLCGDCTDVGHRRRDHLIPLGDTECAQGGMQAGCARSHCDGMTHLKSVTQGRLEFGGNATRAHELARLQCPLQFCQFFGAIAVGHRVGRRLGGRSAADGEFFHLASRLVRR